MSTTYPNPAFVGRNDGRNPSLAFRFTSREELDTHCTTVITRLMQRYLETYWPEVELVLKPNYSEAGLEAMRLESAFQYARHFIDGALQTFAEFDLAVAKVEAELAQCRAADEQSSPPDGF